MSESLYDCMIEWRIDSMTALLNKLITEWLHDGMTKWLNNCIIA
jgi:hypothetical protein